MKIIEGGLSLEFLLEMVKIYSLLMAIFIGLIIIGYYGIFSWIHGNKYLIHYKITDKKIDHVIDKSASDKMKPWIFIGKILSIFSKSPGGYGAQKLAEGRQVMTSYFKDLIKIKIYKNKILIKDRFLRTNVVFTRSDNHQEIKNLIIDACKPSVKIIEK